MEILLHAKFGCENGWVWYLQAVPVQFSWLRGTVVERRSLAGELTLSCARRVADG